MNLLRPLVVIGLLTLPLALVGCGEASAEDRSNAAAFVSAVDRDGFETFISADELTILRAATEAVLIDVRSADAYAAGHLPGAVSLPASTLRTGKAKPGSGDSQYIFRDGDNQGDIARYEQLFGEAGISREHTVILYGNHAGKGDGTVAAMLLDWLGQERIYFLDGVGVDQWQQAGFELDTKPVVLEPTTYIAMPRADFLWNLDDVVAHAGKGTAVFYDTRSLNEYAGIDKRDNVRGGHIPQAIHADYAELLDENKQIKPRAELEAIFARHGLPEAKAANRPIVLYCQTSTRVSLPYLALRELGYENVAVYDASWHEYGNRDDTAIATVE